MDLKFNVNNQIITREGNEKVVNMSEGYLKLVFDFITSDWGEVSKYYISFKGHDGDYRFELESETPSNVTYSASIIVPSFITMGKKFVFGLYGVDANGTIRITTNLAMVRLLDSKFSDGGIDVITRLDYLEEEIVKKEDKVTGKGLSSNDFTDTYKALIDGFDGDFQELINSHLDSIVADTIDSLSNATFYTKPEVDALLTAKDTQCILEGDKTIIEADDTLTLKAYVKKNGVPVYNERVEFYIGED